LVDREPADETCGKGRITRQSLGLLGRQFCEGKAGRGEGVVPRDFSGGIERHKAIADAAADILRSQFPEISVECGHPAGKTGAIMSGAQRFNSERLGHLDGVIWLP
jgi:hypothetical protein